MTILDDIFAHKRTEVAARKGTVSPDEVQAQARQAPPPRDFVAALQDQRQSSVALSLSKGRSAATYASTGPARRRDQAGQQESRSLGFDTLCYSTSARCPALIAEIKRASPSRGLLAPDLDPVHLAHVYQQNGAAAISVLTDEHFFQGSLDHLRAVRREVDLPLLRKDFIFNPYQVYEARAAGADAILLIAAMLDDGDLQALHRLAGELGMAALVEVHDEKELQRALRMGACLVGINNRDLCTFKVDLATTERLRPLVPVGVTLVAESGIHTPADVARLAEIGVDAMLVGESLVTAKDVAAQVRALTSGRWRMANHVPRVKICGVTSADDALAAIEAGADLLGFNFYPQSPRYVAPETCQRIVSRITQHASRSTVVGVFVNSPLDEVKSILNDCGLDLAQLHGDEPPGFLDALDGRAFKGIRPQTLAEAQAAAHRYVRRSLGFDALRYLTSTPALLVDAFRPGVYGGTGETGDWSLARELAADYPILLAGGLRPENVAAAIAQVRPWGVDVASGIESSPGCKDAQKMKEFVQAAKSSLQVRESASEQGSLQ